eukprot:6728093-Pyramimonas_sp.AAC.1
MSTHAEHPGGKAVMQGYSGKDASSAFRKVPHSPAAEAMLEGIKIGVVEAQLHTTRPGLRTATPSAKISRCAPIMLLPASPFQPYKHLVYRPYGMAKHPNVRLSHSSLAFKYPNDQLCASNRGAGRMI